MDSFVDIDKTVKFSRDNRVNIQFIYRYRNELKSIFEFMNLDILNEWKKVKELTNYNNLPIQPSEYFIIWYKYNSKYNKEHFENKHIAINRFIRTINKRIETIATFGNHVWGNLRTTIEHAKKEVINVIGKENTEYIKFIDDFSQVHIDLIELKDSQKKKEKFLQQKAINEANLYNISFENIKIHKGLKKLLKYDLSKDKRIDDVLNFKNLSRRFIEQTNNNLNVLEKLHDRLVNIKIDYDERSVNEFELRHKNIVKTIRQENKDFMFREYYGNNVLSHFRNTYMIFSDPIIESKRFILNHNIKRGEELKLFFETPCSRTVPYMRYKNELYKYFSSNQTYDFDETTKKYINCILFYIHYNDLNLLLSYNINDGHLILRCNTLIKDDEEQNIIDHISNILKIEVYNYQVKLKVKYIVTDFQKNDLLLQHIINLDPIINKMCHFHEVKTSIVNKKLSKFWVNLYNIVNHVYITNGNRDKMVQFNYKDIKLKTLPGQEYVVISITNISNVKRVNMIKEVIKMVIRRYFYNVDKYLEEYANFGVTPDMYNLYRIKYKNRKASDLPLHLNQKSLFNEIYLRYKTANIGEGELNVAIVNKDILNIVQKLGFYNPTYWNGQLWLDRLRKLYQTLYFTPVILFNRDNFNLENPWSVYEYVDPKKQFELSLPELSNKLSHVRCITNFTNIKEVNKQLYYDDPILMKRFVVYTFPMDYIIDGVLHEVDYPRNYYYIANPGSNIVGFNKTSSDKIPIKFNIGTSGTSSRYKGSIKDRTIVITDKTLNNDKSHWNLILNLIDVELETSDENIDNCDIIELVGNKLHINSIFFLYDDIKFKYKDEYSNRVKYDDIKQKLDDYFNVKIHKSFNERLQFETVKLKEYKVEDNSELMAMTIKTLFECFTLIDVDVDRYVIFDDEAHYEFIKYPFFLPNIISAKQIIDLCKKFVKGLVREDKIVINKFLKDAYKNFSSFVTERTNIQNFELSMWTKPTEIVSTTELHITQIVNSSFDVDLNSTTFNLLKNKFIYMSNNLNLIKSLDEGRTRYGVYYENVEPIGKNFITNGNNYVVEF